MYEQEFGARRRRRFRLGAGIVAAGLAVTAVVTVVRHEVQGDTGKVEGSFGWSLVSVSSDGRTLRLVREGNTCPDEALAPVVEETAEVVVVTVPRKVGKLGHDEACTAVSQALPFRVRLDAPLSRRTLRQPAGDFGQVARR